MRPIRKILAVTDFSPCADEALLHALEMARRFDASLTLLHVYSIPVFEMPPGIIVAGSTEMIDGLVRGAREALEERRRGADRPIDVQLVEGMPFIAILQAATEGKYDLLVLGTHGRTGMKHLVFGSVAERVVRKAPCPVLIVHEAKAT